MFWWIINFDYLYLWFEQASTRKHDTFIYLDFVFIYVMNMPGSTYSVHLNDELVAKIEEFRLANEKTRSDVLRDALIEYLEKHGEKKNTETTVLPNVVYPTNDSESLP